MYATWGAFLANPSETSPTIAVVDVFLIFEAVAMVLAFAAGLLTAQLCVKKMRSMWVALMVGTAITAPIMMNGRLVLDEVFIAGTVIGLVGALPRASVGGSRARVVLAIIMPLTLFVYAALGVIQFWFISPENALGKLHWLVFFGVLSVLFGVQNTIPSAQFPESPKLWNWCLGAAVVFQALYIVSAAGAKVATGAVANQQYVQGDSVQWYSLFGSSAYVGLSLMVFTFIGSVSLLRKTPSTNIGPTVLAISVISLAVFAASLTLSRSTLYALLLLVLITSLLLILQRRSGRAFTMALACLSLFFMGLLGSDSAPIDGVRDFARPLDRIARSTILESDSRLSQLERLTRESLQSQVPANSTSVETEAITVDSEPLMVERGPQAIFTDLRIPAFSTGLRTADLVYGLGSATAAVVLLLELGWIGSSIFAFGIVICLIQIARTRKGVAILGLVTVACGVAFLTIVDVTNNSLMYLIILPSTGVVWLTRNN